MHQQTSKDSSNNNDHIPFVFLQHSFLITLHRKRKIFFLKSILPFPYKALLFKQLLLLLLLYCYKSFWLIFFSFHPNHDVVLFVPWLYCCPMMSCRIITMSGKMEMKGKFSCAHCWFSEGLRFISVNFLLTLFCFAYFVLDKKFKNFIYWDRFCFLLGGKLFLSTPRLSSWRKNLIPFVSLINGDFRMVMFRYKTRIWH